MKKNLILFFLLVTINTFSQGLFNSYEKGTIYLRNETKLDGFLKITSDDEVKYKKTLKDKKQLFNHKTVKSVVFTKSKKKYYYKHDKYYVYLLEKEIQGKIELYFKVFSSPPIMGPNGMMMGGGSFKKYYITKKDSDKIEQLDTNVKSREFWLTFSKYVADCQHLINKVKDKKSIKKNYRKKSSRLINMVNDYNTNCR